MNKVLFTNSYFYRLDPKQWKFQQPYPPLGTLQAAAVIRNAGYETLLVDASLSQGPQDIFPQLKKEVPDYFIIYEDGFNYLTKMCLTVMRDAAIKMAAYAKNLGCKVIISSSDATDHYDKYLDHGVDYVIRGEAEETLVELLAALEENNDPHELPGIVSRKNGVTNVTSNRAVIRNLDQLPLPAWDLINPDHYREIWKRRHGYFSLNLATTRGCPYKCNWCAKPIYGNRYNSRTPANVIAEIEYLISNFNPDHFWMCDDIFGLKPKWVEEFARLLKEKNISIRYKIQSRADLLMDEAMVQALAASGCENVWVGAESGSQKILDAMEKGITLDEIHSATLALKKHNINISYFLQFGYPGETKEDIDDTLRMVLKEMPNEIGISVAYPLPGTKFYENVKSHLQEKQNWSDSDELAMLYPGPFPAAYYKILQRYVHSRYRIQRGLNRLHQLIRHPAFYGGDDIRKIASMIYHLPLSFYQAYRLRQLGSSAA